MHAFVGQVEQAIRRHGLIGEGDHVLVGVSGGPDSVALLRALLALRPRIGMRLTIIHVDHQLRQDSSQDAAAVERLAQDWSVDVVLRRCDVAAEAKRDGRSLEDAARVVRYRAFQDVAHRRGAQRVAVAHTADDQAETVLLRLCRGAGVTGLAAMAWQRPLGGSVLIRPLLDVWRRDVCGYLADEGVAARHDPSNDDRRFARNRVRHEVLPWLQAQVNPNIRAALVQLAEQCRWDAAFLAGSAQRHWKRLVKRRGDRLAIRLAPFRRQPRAVQAHLIRMAIAALQGDLTGFEYRHWLEIEALCDGRPVGSVVDLPGALHVGKEPEHLVLWTRPSLRPLALQRMECG
jgi:tRNA(Ile)-lysidine synthase